MTARVKSAGAVGSYYTGAGIADRLAEQVVALRPRSVLDPACGDGRLLDAVRARLPDVPLLGMDADPAAVEAARAKGYDVRLGDSLFDDVPEADIWIANPPYLGGGKISTVLGAEYLRRLQERWGKQGRADLCAYWLRRAHDLGARACVGVYTNTISQGDTRQAGLQYLVHHGWQIVWAERDRRWEGERAAVMVSLCTIHRLPWSTASAESIRLCIEEDAGRLRHAEAYELGRRIGLLEAQSLSIGMELEHARDEERAELVALDERLCAQMNELIAEFNRRRSA